MFVLTDSNLITVHSRKDLLHLYTVQVTCSSDTDISPQGSLHVRGNGRREKKVQMWMGFGAKRTQSKRIERGLKHFEAEEIGFWDHLSRSVQLFEINKSGKRVLLNR